MTATKRWSTLAALAILLSGTASAYTYWVHYASRVAPFSPIPRKYDLSTLWNNTVYFYISDAPLVLAANDTTAGTHSQIRAAAKVWNDVETSSLRVAFGGIYTDGTSQSTPGIQVAFSDDIPPGLWALTGVSESSTPTIASSGSFVPIAGARISLPRDLTKRPSYGEGFFQTVVHEFGHALGLQHTLTSATMSTEVTRGTSKAKPLAVDDIAGLSSLYPSKSYGHSTGSISGRVTMGSDSVSMASVVAISFGGIAVSALTNPDGTYRIDGIPAGSGYIVYVHPLPPALSGESYPAAIEPPVDAQGVSFSPSGPFNLQFYPGTSNWAQATQLTVQAGAVTDGININVSRRASALPLYSVQTFSFPAQFAVKPPYLSRNTFRPYIVASGVGLSASTVGVGLLNAAESIAANGIKTYPYDSRYVQIDIQSTNYFAAEGPRHLIFSRDNDLYILPAGFNLVQRTPPSITSITPGTDPVAGRIVTIAGTNLGADTRIWFDGVQANVLDSTGPLVVQVPPGAGLRSNVAAFNSDGQSSLFLQADNMPGFDFDADTGSSAAITGNAIPAGAEALVQLDTTNMNLVDGVTKLGFGSSDVVVHRMWVVKPTESGGATRILANVSVAPTAPSVAVPVSVVTGLRTWQQPLGFQILPVNNRQLSVTVPGSGLNSPGSTVALSVLNLTAAQASAGVTATLNGQVIPVTSAFQGFVAIQIPSTFPLGPAILRITAAGEPALPYCLNVDPWPPAIVGIANATTQGPVDAAHPAKVGDVVTVSVTQLGDNVSAAQVKLSLGGVDYAATQVQAINGQAGAWQVSFQVGNNLATTGSLSLTITAADGRTSQPVVVWVKSN